MTEWWLMPPQPPPSDDNLTGWAAPSPNKDPSQWWVWRDPTACLSSPCSGPASGYVNCNNGSGRPSRNIWPNFYQVKSDKIIFFLQTTLKLNIKIKSFRTRQNVYKMFIVRWWLSVICNAMQFGHSDVATTRDNSASKNVQDLEDLATRLASSSDLELCRITRFCRIIQFSTF